MSAHGTARARRTLETSPAVVRDVIARGILNGPIAYASTNASDTLGSISLLPHQRDAVIRVRAILRELHVALLADDVGLGKTFVALAIAREYPLATIIAPAALLPMWREAIARTGTTNARIESLHRYSRSSPPAALAHDTLVIIDEAHHLRTPSTRRYRAVSQAVSGRDLLLLSATPVHNTPRDLHALLALAIGTQAVQLDDALLARVVVRRTQHHAIPVVRERPPQAMPHDSGVLDAILRLPAPLPAHDGAVAGALVRLGLLRAWCSSDAALASALRRRLLRGEALKHALEGGRHPTGAELRGWMVGEHEVQLAFPELMAGHAPETGPLLDVLTRHLDAVSALLQRHVRTANGDVARAYALRDILRTHPEMPVIAFSQFAETVRTIGRALSDIAGVGVLTGQRAWIASGAISRQDALAHFAPVAQGRPPPPPHQRIRLLLTTDLLAEGVNLQDAGVLVHLDLPWTDALRRQRVGRCARVGSPHAEIVVYRFEPPQGAELVMRLHARLERKARWSARLVGAPRDEGSHAQRISAADAATRVRSVLVSWLSDARVETDPSHTLVACTTSRVAGFVALVVSGDGASILVGGRQSHDGVRARLRVSASPVRLLPLLLAIADRPAVRGVSAHALTRARRAVRRWIARRSMSVDLGDAESCAAGAQRRAHAALRQAMQGLPATARLRLVQAFREAFEMVERARGVAAEEALRAWVIRRGLEPVDDWLSAWRQVPVLAGLAARAESGASALRGAPQSTRYAVRAMLLCEPLQLQEPM